MTYNNATLVRASRLVLGTRLPDTDKKLLQQFAIDGAQEAFAALVHRHVGMVFKVCQRTLHTPQDAEDACQATFLILARKAAGPWQESVANWLFSTARKVASDVRRGAQRRERRERLAAVPEALASIDSLSARELLAALDDEIDKLPSHYREPLLLFYMEDLCRDEISARLSIPSGTVKIRLERARKNLQIALTKRGFGLGAGFLVMASMTSADASSPRMVEAIVSALAGKPTAVVAALVKRFTGNGSLMKSIALMAVTSAAIAVGAALAAQSQAEPSPQSSTPTRIAESEPQEKSDLEEKLPAGALLRIGSTRFTDGGGAGQAILSPDGKSLATVSEAGIIVFDLGTGRRLHWISDPDVHYGYSKNWSRLAFAPDGKKFFIVSAPGAPTFFSTGSIVVYDTVTWKKLTSFKSPPVARVPNQPLDAGYEGLWFPAGSKYLVAVRDRGTVLIEPDTGKEVRKLEIEPRAVEVTPDGIRLFTYADKKMSVEIYDSEGKQLRTLEHKFQPEILGYDPACTILATANSAESKIRVWEWSSGKVLADIAFAEKINKDAEFTALAITPDGKAVLAGDMKGVIHRFDIATGKEVSSLRGHLNYVTGLFFAGVGKTLVSTSWDHRIIRWDLATGKSRDDSAGFASYLHLDRSPDGKLIVVADHSGRIELIDGKNGELIRMVQEAKKPAVSKLVFSPDAKSFAAVHVDGKLRLWGSATGKLIREMEVVAVPNEAGYWFDGLAFAPDGRVVAASLRSVGTFAFETESGKKLWDDPATTGSLAFSPNGRSLMSSGWDNHITIRDTATGKISRSTQTINSFVDDIAVSPDGRLMATGHHNGIVCLWDAAAGTIHKQWQAHTPGKVTWGVSFSPGGIWLASAGDRTVAIWDVATGTLLHRFEGHICRAHTARFALDSKTLLSSSLDLTGYVWDLKPKFGPEDGRTTAQLWSDLLGEPKDAFRAVWLAADDPKAPALFAEKLPSPKKIDSERFKKLVEQLEDVDFKTRERAEKELSEFGPSALPHAKKAWDAAESPETRDRLNRLIRSWSQDAFTPENWRRRRAVAALEMANTVASRDLLKRWAIDAPGTVLSEASSAALARLEQLNKK